MSKDGMPTAVNKNDYGGNNDSNKENNLVMSLAFTRHCLFSAALLSLLDLCCFMTCALSLVSTNLNGQKNYSLQFV